MRKTEGFDISCGDCVANGFIRNLKPDGEYIIHHTMHAIMLYNRCSVCDAVIVHILTFK